MKKLKRNPSRLESIKKEPVKKKFIIKTKKKQCEYIDDNGKRCSMQTSGKNNFCSAHSNVVFKESNNKIIHHTGGLLTKYDPLNHPLFYIQLSKEGLSPKEIASHFGICINTLEQWANDYPLFQQAYEIGKAAHEAWYLKTGKDNLNNRFFQTPLFKFLTMNNGLSWSDKVDSRSQVQGQFGVLLMPGTMGVDEWEQANIKREEERMKQIESADVEEILTE